MPNEPFDPEDASRFQPADPRTQEELGGVLERSFARERGKEPAEEEVRRLHAMADDALREAEMKLRMAREAEDAMARAAERYGTSGDPVHLADLERWRDAAEAYKREAEELKIEGERLRGRIG